MFASLRDPIPHGQAEKQKRQREVCTFGRRAERQLFTSQLGAPAGILTDNFLCLDTGPSRSFKIKPLAAKTFRQLVPLVFDEAWSLL